MAIGSSYPYGLASLTSMKSGSVQRKKFSVPLGDICDVTRKLLPLFLIFNRVLVFALFHETLDGLVNFILACFLLLISFFFNHLLNHSFSIPFKTFSNTIKINLN